MTTEDPEDKKKVTPSRQSPPQEAEVLRDQLEQAIGPYTFAKDGLVNEILEIFSTAVGGMIPPKRGMFNMLDSQTAMPSEIVGYNAAIAEMQRRRKELGL